MSTTTKPAAPAAFTFGEPVPVMDRSNILDYIEAVPFGKWYEPPISFEGLAKSKRASVHHESALAVKRNILASTYIPHPLLSETQFAALVDNYLTFGNGYLEIHRNMWGQPVKLTNLLAKYMRRGIDLSSYWFVTGLKDDHQFASGSVLHLLQPDIHQEVYGLPEYLAALNSAWLNESATLFRRKYFENGSHAGFILYVSDPAQQEEDIDALRKALRESKGVGNFRNLFYYSPNGKKDGIQLIPISEVAAKDEFFNIKNVTRDDVLAAHRVPPQLMGIVPNNTGGFGDVEKAATVFYRNEILPLQTRLKEINALLKTEVIRFNPYTLT